MEDPVGAEIRKKTMMTTIRVAMPIEEESNNNPKNVESAQVVPHSDPA